MYILGDKVDFWVNVPVGDLNILKSEISARVGRVASDDTRREHASVDVNVAESDVSDSDSWLSVALLHERVEHAAWAATVWLLLLLRSNVDGPPKRSLYSESIIEDVLNQAVAISSWVCLYVDCLEGVLERDVAEGNVSDAVVLTVRRHCADGHAYSVVHEHILN